MKPVEAIETMLERSSRTKLELAAALGRSKNSVYNMFRENPDIRTSTLLESCKFAGYEIRLVSHEGDTIILDEPSFHQRPAPGK